MSVIDKSTLDEIVGLVSEIIELPYFDAFKSHQMERLIEIYNDDPEINKGKKASINSSHDTNEVLFYFMSLTLFVKDNAYAE